MKRTFISIFVLISALSVLAQEPKPAETGITYGSGASLTGVVPISDLNKFIRDNKFEGKISGRVVEVCQEKGCWMKVERANSETLMVKFKDYGFFMPKDIVGKEVVLDGEATIKEISVNQQRHYAKDAGKSKEEINSIREPKKELQFVAKGVRVL